MTKAGWYIKSALMPSKKENYSQFMKMFKDVPKKIRKNRALLPWFLVNNTSHKNLRWLKIF